MGVGLGSSAEVPQQLKGYHAVQKHYCCSFVKSSIPHDTSQIQGSKGVLLKPAPLGTGLKVGSVARNTKLAG
ncbi:hypothetical protein IPH70_03525 [Candidatus Roizmanbacteria bacterium]|nr:MAG: hypothetical protein IPH70_03525 [Candidatus Roizmanbacteria bacterium]